MRLFKASLHDDEEIKAFFSEQVVPGIFDFKVVRPHSFFDQYKLTTNDFQTYLLKDADKKIHAMASILFRKAYVNKQEQNIGYVTDLRVSHSRKATLTWGKEFIPMMIEEKQKRNCQFVFSDLESFENKTYNTLLRRRNRMSHLPRFHLFRKFNLIIIFGKRLFHRPPIHSIRMERGRTEDIEPLCKFLREKAVRRPLYYNLTPEELERRCREWPNFSIQNFYITRNSQDKIIGCMAPWNNRDVQKVVVNQYRSKSFQVYSTSQLLKYTKLTRPFARTGEAFRLKHLTHSAFDNPDIFHALLSKCYDDCQNQELLVYPNYFGDYASRPPQAFIHTKIPYGFYTLLENDKTLPTYLHPNPFNPAPDFQYSHF